MDSVRETALAPLSRSDAERLLPELAAGRRTVERRVLRARRLKYLESVDLAWAELTAVFPLVRDPLLQARVAVDLMHLSYYLVRRDDFQRCRALAEAPAAADPLILAELHLGCSIVDTASNEIAAALRQARRADDALAGASRGRGRDLVTTRVQRQLAHLLSHSGVNVGARAAADATVRHAARTRRRSACAPSASPGARSGSCARWSSSPARGSASTARLSASPPRVWRARRVGRGATSRTRRGTGR